MLNRLSALRSWLFSWEIYLIILIASFLRFYRLGDTFQFDADQANLYRMAYDAVHHGLIPVTSNGVSFGGVHQAAIVYILMLPAVFTANPLGAAIMMASLSVIAVLLTYVFTRRYYGRLTGTLAALFFATFFQAVDYSRLIWNHNLLAFFTPLFMFALFRGVVDRKKGWLLPALIWLGIMLQLHNSSGLLAVALLAAIILAPGTIHWRDLVFVGLALFILFLPELVWGIHSGFSDITDILQASKQPSHIDNQALFFYQQYLEAYIPDNISRSAIALFVPVINWVNGLTILLFFLALLMVCVLLVWQRGRSTEMPEKQPASTGLWKRGWNWLKDFRADPSRCGLLVLLLWQVVPLLYLTRHSITLYLHYFIYLMPGQYILLALLLTGVIRWFSQFKGWRQCARVVVCLLAVLIVVTQCVGSLGNVVDRTRGNITDGHFMDGDYASHGYRNDFIDLQNAFAKAEQVARQYHLNHLYISDYNTYDYITNLTYLAEHAPIATTVFTDRCLILPNPANGPAVFLEGPYDDFTDALLPRFASATLVGKSPRHGGDPFKLYIINTSATQSTVEASFPQETQLLDTQPFSFQNTPWAVTHWNALRSMPIHYQTLYNYNMANLNNPDNGDNPDQVGQCFFSSIQRGDQLLVAFPLGSSGKTLTLLSIQVQSRTLTPRIFTPGLLKRLGISLSFEAVSTTMQFPPDSTLPITVLHTSDGSDHVVISLLKQKTGGSKKK